MANIAIFILHIILTLFSYHWLYGINIDNVSSVPMIRRNIWRSFRLKSENSLSNYHSYHWYNRVTQTYMYRRISSRYEKIVKQWCSTMTPTSTKRTITSNIHLLNTIPRNMTFEILVLAWERLKNMFLLKTKV